MSQRTRIPKKTATDQVQIPEKGKVDIKSIEAKAPNKKDREKSPSYFQLRKELEHEVNRSVFSPKDRNDEYVSVVKKDDSERARAKQVKLEYKRLSKLQA